MRIFLLWGKAKQLENSQQPEHVTSRLQKLFSPIFKDSPDLTFHKTHLGNLITLQLPVTGWKPSFVQEDELTWAYAAEYPVNAHSVLKAYSGHLKLENLLPSLCRELETNPHPLLRELTPPYSLVWLSKLTGEFYVQNDGLGQAQLFEYRKGDFWAISNKIIAFAALGKQLEFDEIDWAARFTLSWFPMDTSGFKHIRYIAPSTQLQLKTQGNKRIHHNILTEWIHPDPLTKKQTLELARNSICKQLEAITPLCDKTTVGLSGGWDSRALVACLRSTDLSFSARVRGSLNRPDVIIATRLAKIAGFPLRVKKSTGLPPEDADRCQKRIMSALLWQAGAMVTHKHKVFLSKSLYLDGGVVNLMGQHGEIGRSFYALKIKANDSDENELDDLLLEFLLKNKLRLLRPKLRSAVCERIYEAIAQSNQFDLKGSSRLDFFYLYERTRRWASGSLNSQTGLVLAPFLNPDYIRAVYSLQKFKATNPFHRYIIAIHAPDWINIPFSEDIKLPQSTDMKAIQDWKQPVKGNNYNSLAYWNSVGKPIIEHALSQEGFWSQILDPDMLKNEWTDVADDLALLHLLPETLVYASELMAT